MTDSPEATVTVTVEGHDQTAGLNVDLVIEEWTELARQVLVEEGVASGHLDLIFVDPEPMAELNRTHLGGEGPTDVLSFPLDGPQVVSAAPSPAAGAVPAGEGPPVALGDVVVCPQVAAIQAPDHAGSLAAELALLVVHGVLHILGHDHAEADETLIMQARERHYLTRRGHHHPIPAPALDPRVEGDPR